MYECFTVYIHNSIFFSESTYAWLVYILTFQTNNPMFIKPSIFPFDVSQDTDGIFDTLFLVQHRKNYSILVVFSQI